MKQYALPIKVPQPSVDGGKAVEIKVPSSEDKEDDEDAKSGEDYFDISLVMSAGNCQSSRRCR